MPRKLLASAIFLALLALGLPAAPPPASALETYPVGAGITVTGRGYGHGYGLSQWGARGAASQGLGAAQILQFYYPGTMLTGQPNSAISVRLSTGRSGEVSVDAGPAMALIWQGGTLALPSVSPGGARILSWRLVQGGPGLLLHYVDSSAAVWRQYSVVPGTFGHLSSSKGTVRLVGASYERREYRGTVGAQISGGALLTVNTVPMESYLRAVVPAEMPQTWPAAALAAQTVAARTYASHQRHNATGPAQTCDTTACQVYQGVARYSINGALLTQYEAATTDAAIASTANQVLITGGAFSYAFTQFSSSNGGWSRTGSQPYLTARRDPYDGLGGNPQSQWQATVSTQTIANAYPMVGTPIRLAVLSRDGNGQWGGRVTSVRVEGTAGSTVVTGDQLRTALGLRSTWWTTTTPTQTSGGILLDVTGDGYPDALGRQAATGALWLYPGTANGSFSAARSVGTGWQMHDWIGSPGDFTADGIPDLIAREAATGSLWLYPMQRSGVAASRRIIGTGWHSIDLIIAPGDVTGDGVPDIYGRQGDSGALLFYAGVANGGFRAGVAVNSGWSGIDVVTGAGDLTGDGVPDLIGRNAATGALILYTLSRDGRVPAAKTIGSGWGGFDQIVTARTSSGAIVYGRDPYRGDGTLWAYPLRVPGTFSAPFLVGTGWNLHSSLS